MVQSFYYNHNEPPGFLISLKHAVNKSTISRVKFGNDVMDVSYNRIDGGNTTIELASSYSKWFSGSLYFESSGSYFSKPCHVVQFDDWPEYDVMQVTVEYSWY